MGLFNLSKDSSSTVGNSQTMPTENVVPAILNLEKNGILDLSKYNLHKITASAGWKVNKKRDCEDDYDLDLCAYLMDKDGKIRDTVYYADKHKKHDPVWLDKDNLTGSEDGGDNENIFVNLDDVPQCITEIYFAVVIFMAKDRKQSFDEVEGAYIKLIDESNGHHEICRYSMSEDGGSKTAVVAGKLSRTNGNWKFVAIGEYFKKSIEKLGKKLPIE